MLLRVNRESTPRPKASGSNDERGQTMTTTGPGHIETIQMACVEWGGGHPSDDDLRTLLSEQWDDGEH